MELSNLRNPGLDEVVMKTGKAAGIGLASGTVWGGVVAMHFNGPHVGSNVKYPELVRIGKVSGNYAASFALLGATYVGIEQSLENCRKKKDYINGAVAGFTAGATVLGFRARSLPTAVLSGCAIALTSVLLDVTGMKTTDEEAKTGKAHH
uniref:Mitochondrial import inner membrane translocase subunit TIM22 n=1 Tax=Oryza glumipatula TaxID=40148 RepID=A0A0E0B0P6_9ORYZ